jgi:hypothetical protein
MQTQSIIHNLDSYNEQLNNLINYTEQLINNKHLLSKENYLNELKFVTQKFTSKFYTLTETSNIMHLVEISGGLNEYLVKRNGEEFYLDKSELISIAENMSTRKGYKGYGKIGSFIQYKHNSYFNIVLLDMDSLYLDEEYIKELKANANIKK